MYKHILIATDGSELADKGVEQGLKLASALGARVTVLTVSAPLSSKAALSAQAGGLTDPALRYDQQIDDVTKNHFAVIEDKAGVHGVAVTFTHEIDVSPAEAIVRFAELEKCDLIVMASHGRKGVRRLVLGSQTEAVVTSTSIAVLVVR